MLNKSTLATTQLFGNYRPFGLDAFLALEFPGLPTCAVCPRYPLLRVPKYHLQSHLERREGENPILKSCSKSLKRCS